MLSLRLLRARIIGLSILTEPEYHTYLIIPQFFCEIPQVIRIFEICDLIAALTVYFQCIYHSVS